MSSRPSSGEPLTGSDTPELSGVSGVRPAPDPRVGTTLGQGKYHITGKLGEGGMGIVYEAEDVRLQRRVAIKLLPEDVAQDEHALERFLREARAAARLNHPNIIGVLDVDQRDGVTYIVMELVRGGSASDLLVRQGLLSWQEATRIIADACRGLVAAHGVGLIHRDIKPANLLLGVVSGGVVSGGVVSGGVVSGGVVSGGVVSGGMVSGSNSAPPPSHPSPLTSHQSPLTPHPSPLTYQVKVADFGLAKVVNQSGTSLTTTGNVVGTPDYMSPEQCRAERLDDRSDIYSLGATYFKLLTGRPPFEADTPLQVLFAHCQQAVPDPRQIDPQLPESCATVTTKALAKEPRDRFQSAAAMLAALEKVLDGTLPAPPPSAGAPPTLRPPLERTTITQPDLQPARAAAAVTEGKTALLPASRPWRRRWLLVLGVLAILLVVGWLYRYQLLRLYFNLRGPLPRGNNPSTVLPVDHSAAGLVLQADGKVEALALSNISGWLAAASGDGGGGLRVWRLADPQQQQHLWAGTPTRSAAFAGGGMYLAAGSDDSVRFWHVNNFGASLTIGAEDGARAPVAFTSNSLAAGGKDGLLFYDYAKRARRQRLDGVRDVTTLAVNADSQLLAVGSRDGTVRVFNATGTPERPEFKADGVLAGMAFSPPDRPEVKLTHPGRWLGLATSKDLEFFNLNFNNRVAIWIREPVRCVVYSPDGYFWAAGLDSGGIRLRDNTRKDKVVLLPGHTGGTRALVFTADGKTLISGGADGCVRFWDVGKHRE